MQNEREKRREMLEYESEKSPEVTEVSSGD
jgi:hypothetical protein